VLVLDFGSHEHCGGCRLLYPRLRQIADEFRGRRLVVLGVNNNDSREVLNQLRTSGEVTWRIWWDDDKPDGPGPITTRCNVQGYPSFIVLDHRGTNRFKDLHPQDIRGFDDAVEKLVKQAEGDVLKR
jgi:thiol-disulfide isomerase/thioredoxin